MGVLREHNAEDVEEELQRVAVEEVHGEELLQREVDRRASVGQRKERVARRLDLRHDGIGLADLLADISSLAVR
jgi:hypothetical protein